MFSASACEKMKDWDCFTETRSAQKGQHFLSGTQTEGKTSLEHMSHAINMTESLARDELTIALYNSFTLLFSEEENADSMETHFSLQLSLN